MSHSLPKMAESGSDSDESDVHSSPAVMKRKKSKANVSNSEDDVSSHDEASPPRKKTKPQKKKSKSKKSSDDKEGKKSSKKTKKKKKVDNDDDDKENSYRNVGNDDNNPQDDLKKMSNKRLVPRPLCALHPITLGWTTQVRHTTLIPAQTGAQMYASDQVEEWRHQYGNDIVEMARLSTPTLERNNAFPRKLDDDMPAHVQLKPSAIISTDVCQFDDIEGKEYLQKRDKMMILAKIMASPMMNDDVAMRIVESDQQRMMNIDENVMFTKYEPSYSSRAMETIKNLHPLSAFDAFNTPHSVFFPAPFGGFSDRILNQSELGGFEFPHVCFFVIDKGRDPSNFDSTLLELASLITSYLANPDKFENGKRPNWWAVTTPFTSAGHYAYNNSVHRCNDVQFCVGCNEAEIGKYSHVHLWHEMEHDIMEKVVKYRLKQRTDEDVQVSIEDSLIFPNVRKVESDKQGFPSDQDRSPLIKNLQHVVDIFYGTEVLRGTDINGDHINVVVDQLIIKAKCPGVDPAVILEQMCDNVQAREKMMEVVMHMGNVLNVTNFSNNVVKGSSFFDPHAAINMCSMCIHQQVPMAIFKFCKDQVTDINYNGMVLDLAFEPEVAAYEEYLKFCRRARIAHWAEIKKMTLEDTFTPKIAKASTKPHDVYNCDIWQFPVNWKRVSSKKLREAVETSVERMLMEEKEKMTDEIYADAYLQEVELRMAHFQEVAQTSSTWMYDEQEDMFYRQYGGLAIHGGVWVHASLSACKVHKTTNNNGTYDFSRMLPQPSKGSHQARLVLMFAGMEHDPLKFLFNLDNEVVVDKEWMEFNMDDLKPELVEIYNFLKNPIQDMRSITSLKANSQMIDILKTYGNIMHPAVAKIKTVYDHTSIKHVASHHNDILEKEIKNVVSDAINCSVMKWKAVAEVVDGWNREKYMDRSSMYKEWNSLYKQKLESDHNWKTMHATFGDSNAMAAFFENVGRDRLQAELSHDNQKLLDMITNSVSAGWQYQKQGYGFPIIICDVGGALTLIQNIKGEEKEVIVTQKSPGAGCDGLLDIYTLRARAWGTDLCDNHFVNNHFLHNKDETVTDVSKYQLFQINGASIPIKKDGDIKEDAYDASNAGASVFITEGGEVQGVEHFSAQLKHVKTCFADSGTQRGSLINYTTTVEGKKVKYQQAFPLPVTVIASNNQINIPISMDGGGRAMKVSSSVMDGEVGVLKLTRSKTTANAKANTTFRFLGQKTNTKMRTLNSALIQSNKIYLLAHFLIRYGVLLQRTLTSEPPKCMFQIRSGNISETLYSLSTGIRKGCFTRDEKTVMRILRGPFESVCVRGRSTQNWTFFCLAKAFKLAEAGENGRVKVNIHKAFENLMKMHYTVPISLSSSLSGMYDYLTNCMVDPTIMGFATFMMGQYGLEQNCPLEIIALVMANQKITMSQRFKYNVLCEFLLEMVLEYENELSFEDTTTNAPIPSKLLEAKSMNQLSDIFSFMNRDEWASICNIRTNMLLSKTKEKYIAPRPIRYITDNIHPSVKDFIEMKTQQQGRGRPRGKTSKDSLDTIQWQAFADGMTKPKDAIRVESQPKLPNYQKQCADQWNCIYRGIGMPDMQTTTIADFQVPYQTGTFFKKIVETTGSFEGLSSHCLQFMGLDQNCSRRDFFHKLFRDFMNFVPLCFRLTYNVREFTEAEKTKFRTGVLNAFKSSEMTCPAVDQANLQMNHVTIKSVVVDDKLNPPEIMVYARMTLENVNLESTQKTYKRLRKLKKTMRDVSNLLGLFNTHLRGAGARDARTVSIGEIPGTTSGNFFWTQPIVPRDRDLMQKVWKIGLIPYIDKMVGDKPVGVEAVIGMDVWIIVLFQALFCHEWKKDHQVYHSRNVSYASREMMQVFLHTEIGISEIVANDGKILLPQCSPCKHSALANVVINFHPSLHAENWGNDEDKFNMISVGIRHKENFTMLNLASGRRMWYRRMLDDVARANVTHEGHVFPLPPESVAHMLPSYLWMQKIYERVVASGQARLNHALCSALLEYGCKSFDGETVSHIPPTLTYCSMKDGEIPCYTYDGALFVLKIVDSMTFEIVPVRPTHDIFSEYENKICVEWRPLEIKDGVQFPKVDLDISMSHGFIRSHDQEQRRLQHRTQDDIFHHNTKTESSTQKHERVVTVPYTFFPGFVRWSCLLKMELSSSDVVMACPFLSFRSDLPLAKNKSSQTFRMIEKDVVYEMMKNTAITLKTDENAVHSALSHSGCTMLLKRFIKAQKDHDIDVGVCAEEHDTTASIFMTITAGSSESLLTTNQTYFRVFNSFEHFKFELQSPKNLIENITQPFTHMVPEKSFFESQSLGERKFWPIHMQPGNDNMYFEITEFDDSDFKRERDNMLRLRSLVRTLKSDTDDYESCNEDYVNACKNVQETRVTLKQTTKWLMGKQPTFVPQCGPITTDLEGPDKKQLWAHVVQYDDDEAGHWMRGGLHMLKWIDCDKKKVVSMKMDFMTLTRCIVPEGSSLYIRVTPTILRELCALQSVHAVHGMLPDESLHQNFIDTHDDDDAPPVYLECFYILSPEEAATDTSSLKTFASSSKIRVMVVSHTCVDENNEEYIYSDSSTQKHTFFIHVYAPNAQPIIVSSPPPHSTVYPNLIENLHAMQVDSLDTHTDMEESTRFICEDTH